MSGLLGQGGRLLAAKTTSAPAATTTGSAVVLAGRLTAAGNVTLPSGTRRVLCVLQGTDAAGGSTFDVTINGIVAVSYWNKPQGAAGVTGPSWPLYGPAFATAEFWAELSIDVNRGGAASTAFMASASDDNFAAGDPARASGFVPLAALATTLGLAVVGAPTFELAVFAEGVF